MRQLRTSGVYIESANFRLNEYFMALSIGDLKVGSVIKFNGEPYQVTKNKHVHTGRGKSVMQTKLRHLVNGSVTEKTFATPEFEWADIEKVKAQYLYKDSDEVHFMVADTYEQVALPMDLMEDLVLYLKEGMEVYLMKFEDKVVSCEVPPKVVLEVIETPPGVKGDTATGGNKPATLETGLVVNVPLFINQGDKIRINTDTNTYYERA